jgi:hypothetical protein
MCYNGHFLWNVAGGGRPRSGFGRALLLTTTILMLTFAVVDATTSVYDKMLLKYQEPESSFTFEHSPESVSRLNYGIRFKFVGSFQHVTQIWRHTFAIKLPDHMFSANFTTQRSALTSPLDHTGEGRFLFCVNSINWTTHHETGEQVNAKYHSKSSCGQFIRNVAFLTKLGKTGHTRLRQLVDTIREVVTHDSRLLSKKRGIFDFVGDGLHYLFGVGRSSEIHQLGVHVSQMSKAVSNELKVLKMSAVHLNSYIAAQDARMDNVVQAMKNMALENFKLAESVSTARTDYVMQTLMYVNDINLHTFELMLAIDRLAAYYANFLNALETLVAGKIPAFLIRAETLQGVLNDIGERVA